MSDPLSYERIAVIRRTLDERQSNCPMRAILLAISGAGYALVRESEALDRVREIVSTKTAFDGLKECDHEDLAIVESILHATIPSASCVEWETSERLLAIADVAHALYRLRAEPFE